MIMNSLTSGTSYFEVVWPLGRLVSEQVDLAAPLVDLNGKTICELWDWVFKGDKMYPIINEELRKRYPKVKIVDYETMGDTHGNDSREFLAKLPDVLLQHGGDAVISAVGA